MAIIKYRAIKALDYLLRLSNSPQELLIWMKTEATLVHKTIVARVGLEPTTNGL